MANRYELIADYDPVDGAWNGQLADFEEGVTYGRTLQQLQKGMREVLAFLIDESKADSAEFDIRVNKAGVAQRDLEEYAEMASAAEEMVLRVRSVRYKLAAKMAKRGLSVRDVGDLLGVSGGRVSQILTEDRGRALVGAGGPIMEKKAPKKKAAKKKAVKKKAVKKKATSKKVTRRR